MKCNELGGSWKCQTLPWTLRLKCFSFGDEAVGVAKKELFWIEWWLVEQISS